MQICQFNVIKVMVNYTGNGKAFCISWQAEKVQ